MLKSAGVCPFTVVFFVSKCVHVHGFGRLEARFQLKLGCRKQPSEMVGQSRARCTEKYRNMTSRGSILDHLEAMWALLGRSLTSSGTVLASTWGPQACFFAILLEKCDLCNSMPLSSGIDTIAGPGPKLEPLGQKSRARSVQNCLEVASQRGQDSQVWLVGLVLLSGLWNSSGNQARTMGTQIRQS